MPKQILSNRPPVVDKGNVSGATGDAFLGNATNLFEAAQAAAEAGAQVDDWSILIGWNGEVRMVAASDWPLDSLKAHHGARMAYRVRQHDRKVCVEGRAGSRTCLFEIAKPDGAARLLLATTPLYQLA